MMDKFQINICARALYVLIDSPKDSYEYKRWNIILTCLEIYVSISTLISHYSLIESEFKTNEG